jgi:transcriptional regulator with XRE-family HTH domain
MRFGEKLSKLRKEYNYTQEQLADILGVSRQSISKWESDIAYPETDKLIALGELFECSMDYFLKEKITEKSSTLPASTMGIIDKIKNSAMTDKNKRRAKKILKIVCIVLGVILAIDILSMILYFSIKGIPS